MARMRKNYRIAAIAGDGIGKEVMPQGLRVLKVAAARFGFDLQVDSFDFASADYYLQHGSMLPDNWIEQIGGHDAIFFGAVGWPAVVPIIFHCGARCCNSVVSSTNMSIYAQSA